MTDRRAVPRLAHTTEAASMDWPHEFSFRYQSIEPDTIFERVFDSKRDQT